ncbi:MAG: NAD(P)-binding protein [Bacteroidales bacterium]|nr:NAD(P)-binding protein [Bacteroidales bacterium]
MKKKVVVLGAGLGGLSAAISLAAHEQYDITIVEKNKHLGGKLNVLVKDGFSFDLGPSIFTMPHIFEELFLMHGKNMDDYFKLTPVRPHWRNFFEDGTIIDLEAKIDDMINQEKITEKDVIELKAFYDYTERLYNFTNDVFFDQQSDTLLDTIKY